MPPDHITVEEILSGLVDLPANDQVQVLEQFMGDGPIEDIADVAAMGLMTVRLGMEGESWPEELVARVEAMSDKLAEFNRARFGDSPAEA